MRRTLLGVFVSLSVVFVSVSALASVRNVPVKIRMEGTPRAAKAWEVYTGVFVLEAGVAVELTKVAFVGVGWRLKELQAPASLQLAAGETIRIPFSAIPTDPEKLIGLSYTVDDQQQSVTMVVGPEYLADKLEPRRLIPAETTKSVGEELRWPDKSRALKAEASAARRKGQPLGEELEKGVGTAARKIRVSGSVRYRRWNHPVSKDFTVSEYPSGFLIEVYDEDSTWDELVGEGYTDADGNFDISFTWDPCYFCDEVPDLYVDVVTKDGRLRVESPIWEYAYTWSSWVKDDYTGSDLDFGSLLLSGDVPAAHIFQTVNRGIDVYIAHGYDMDLVDIQFPSFTSSYYNPILNEIHLNDVHRWSEGTYLHEYGHFWDDQFSTFPLPDYWNGICDGLITPGHCQWCQEEWLDDVENEAWAEYLSILIGKELNAMSQPPLGVFSLTEDTEDCVDANGEDCDCAPMYTEGFVTAFLADVADAENEDDELYQPGFSDVVTLDPWLLPIICDQEAPSSVRGWFNALVARYPQLRNELWETAMNNNLDFDLTPPDVISDLHSPTHDGLVDSPDGTIELKWTTPIDDTSGIAGYSYVVSQTVGTPPPTGMNLGPVNFLNTPVVGTGIWYVSLRSFDRAGRMSDSFATVGPYVVREPYPADLIPRTPATWDAPLVVYHTHNTSDTFTIPPLLLNGDHDLTYFALGMHNNGESFGDQMDLETYLNGAKVDSLALGGATPFMQFTRVNYNPTAMGGGRHTIGMIVDAGEDVPELDETNNTYGAQYGWLGEELFVTGPQVKSAPMAPMGGVAEFGGIYYNADGYITQHNANWNAITAYPSDISLDYDVRLHQPQTSNTDGFGANEAYSSQPAGMLDAVLVNKHSSPQHFWDVGVLGDPVADPATYSPYILEHVASQYIGVMGSHAWSWTSLQQLSLKEFRVFTLDADDLTITLQTNIPGTKVQLAWFGRYFNLGTLDQATMVATTDETGKAVLTFNAQFVGFHCLAIYRHPADGFQAMNLELTIEATPADLVPVTPEVWVEPLVPNSVQMPAGIMPDTLFGNTFMTNGTYFNFAVWNNGGLDAWGVEAEIHVDGLATTWGSSWPVLVENQVGVHLGSTMRTIRGGRHTMSLHVDIPDSVAESSETNNVYASQWVWSPYTLAYGTMTMRPMPPLDTGGRQHLALGMDKGRNCDGLRLPAPGHTDPGTWQGLGVLPRGEELLYLEVFDVAAGVKDGFSYDFKRGASYWGGGGLNYVLINNQYASPGAYDVGVATPDSLGLGYYLQTFNSTPVTPDESGILAQESMPALDFMHVYEVFLDPGEYSVEVSTLEGALDWGIAVHRDTVPSGDSGFQARSASIYNARAWRAPAGASELVSFSGTMTRERYSIVVYRPTSADIQEGGAYRLTLLNGLSGVIDLPAVGKTGISRVYPNPFNPQTTIEFGLIAAGLVELDVYDVRGSRVRVLIRESMDQGRHTAIWDGTDDHGRALASGVYFVRLKSGGIVGVERVVLVE